MRSRHFLLIGIVVFLLVLAVALPLFNRAQAEITVYASPIQAGCYIAVPNDCRLHVEPFTINLYSGSKLVFFQLLAQRSGGGMQVICDFRPDVSNPVPFTGSIYTPSLVAQDFAATCGQQYTVSLQGRDAHDSSAYNLGSTGQITCPSTTP
jgi:hypothetical protein